MRQWVVKRILNFLHTNKSVDLTENESIKDELQKCLLDVKDAIEVINNHNLFKDDYIKLHDEFKEWWRIQKFEDY